MAKRQFIAVPEALVTEGSVPEPAGARMGNTFFSGAITGLDTRTGKLADTPADQAKLAFEHIRTLLRSADFGTDDIAHMFVWYKDHKYRDIVNGPFLEMFPDQTNRPTRHALIRDLPSDTLIQLEIIAVKNGDGRCIEVPGIAHGGNIPGLVPYGRQVGNMLFSGGNTGRDRHTGKLGQTLEQQAELAFQDTRALLEAAGFSSEDVAHLYLWMTHPEDVAAINKPYVEMFPDPKSRPACHAVTAVPMSGDVLLQVEMMAVRGGNRESVNQPMDVHAEKGQISPMPMGTKVGNMLFSGALTGQDPATGRMAQGADAQAALAFRNMQTLLESAGFSNDDVGHLFIWTASQEHRESALRKFTQTFPNSGDMPATHAITADLPGDALLHLEIIAVR